MYQLLYLSKLFISQFIKLQNRMYNKTTYLYCASIYLRWFQFAFGKIERYNFQGNNNIDLIKFNTCSILILSSSGFCMDGLTKYILEDNGNTSVCILSSLIKI